MYYYGARYYDPRISIWLSLDPLVEQTMDAYGYCYNNPINLIDPTGMSPDPPTEGKIENGTIHTEGESSWKYNSADNTWWDQTGDGNNIYHGTTKLNEVIIGVNEKGNEFSIEEGNSRRQLSAEYMKNEVGIGCVLSSNDWISQFTQPRPNVACKRTCDLIAGVSSVNRAINVAKESNNQIIATTNFGIGIETINNYLEQGRPITVGVHHKFNAGNNEGTTDHYIVIVGRGITNNQVYYRFYDVATKHRNLGTSPLNRLYLNGNSATGNTAYTNRRKYTLTQIRPN